MYIRDIAKQEKLDLADLSSSLQPAPNINLEQQQPITVLPSVTQPETNFVEGALQGVASFFGIANASLKSDAFEYLFKELINKKYAKLPFDVFVAVRGTIVASEFIAIRDQDDLNAIVHMLENNLHDGSEQISRFIAVFKQKYAKSELPQIRYALAKLAQDTVYTVFKERMAITKLFCALGEMIYKSLYNDIAQATKYKSHSNKIKNSNILNQSNPVQVVQQVLKLIPQLLPANQSERRLIEATTKILNDPNHSIHYGCEQFSQEILNILWMYVNQFSVTSKLNDNGDKVYVFKAISCDFDTVLDKLFELEFKKNGQLAEKDLKDLELRIYCEHSLRISKKKYRLPSLNLVIFTPTIYAIDNEINIDTSGLEVKYVPVDKKELRGKDATNSNECGTRGLNGETGAYGNPGGHIHLIATSLYFPNEQTFKVNLEAKGSKGANGQPGGDGGKGFDGTDGTPGIVKLEKIINVKQEHSVLVFAYGGEGILGTMGGKGGNPGAGGKGGKGCTTEFHIFNHGSFNFKKDETKEEADRGKDGVPGDDGPSGRHGKPGLDCFHYSVNYFKTANANSRQGGGIPRGPGSQEKVFKGYIEHDIYRRDKFKPGEVFTIHNPDEISRFQALIMEPNFLINEPETSERFTVTKYAEKARKGAVQEFVLAPQKRAAINISVCLEEYLQLLSVAADYNCQAIAQFTASLYDSHVKGELGIDKPYIVNHHAIFISREQQWLLNVQQLNATILYPSNADKVNYAALMVRINYDQRLNVNDKNKNGLANKVMAEINEAINKKIALKDDFSHKYSSLDSTSKAALDQKLYLYRMLQLTNKIEKYGAQLSLCNDTNNNILTTAFYDELLTNGDAIVVIYTDWLKPIEDRLNLQVLRPAIQRFNIKPNVTDLNIIVAETLLQFSSAHALTAYSELLYSLFDFTQYIEAIQHNYKLAQVSLPKQTHRVHACFEIQTQTMQLLRTLESNLGLSHTIIDPEKIIEVGDLEEVRKSILLKRYTGAVQTALETKFSAFAFCKDVLKLKAASIKEEQKARYYANENLLGEIIDELERQWLKCILDEIVPTNLPLSADWNTIKKKLNNALSIGSKVDIINCILSELIADPAKRTYAVSKFVVALLKHLDGSNVYFISEIIYHCCISDDQVVAQFAIPRIMAWLENTSAIEPVVFAGIAVILRDFSEVLVTGRIRISEDPQVAYTVYHGVKNLLPDLPQLICLEQIVATGANLELLLNQAHDKFGKSVECNLIHYMMRNFTNASNIFQEAIARSRDLKQFSNTIACYVVEAKITEIELYFAQHADSFIKSNYEQLADLLRRAVPLLLKYAKNNVVLGFDSVLLMIHKFANFYAASPLGMPIDEFQNCIELMRKICNIALIENLIYTTDPDRWFKKLVNIAIQGLVRYKFLSPTDKESASHQIEDDIEFIATCLNNINPGYYNCVYNKILSLINQEQSEKNADQQQVEPTLVTVRSVISKLVKLQYSPDYVLYLASASFDEWERLLDSFFCKQIAQQLCENNLPEAFRIQAILIALHEKQSSKTKEAFMGFVTMLPEVRTKTSHSDLMYVLTSMFYDNIEFYEVASLIGQKSSKLLPALVKEFRDNKSNKTKELELQDIQKYIELQDTQVKVDTLLGEATQVRDHIKLVQQKFNAPGESDFAQWYGQSIMREVNELRKRDNKSTTQQARQKVAENITRLIAEIAIAFWFANNKGSSLYLTQIVTLILLARTTDRGLLAQIKTGEGKTNIVGCFAVFKALCNYYVDVTSSEVNLVVAGHKKNKKLFDICQISSNFLNFSKEAMDHFEPFKSEVVYGTTKDFQSAFLTLFRDPQKAILYKQRLETCENAVIVDEVDSTLLDQATRMLYKPLSTDDLYPLENLDANIWASVLSMQQTEPKLVEKELKIIASGLCRMITEGSIEVPPHLLDFCKEQMLSWVKKFNDIKMSTRQNTNFRLEIVQPAGFRETGANRLLKIIDVDTGTEEERMRWANGAAQACDLRYRSRYEPRTPTCDFISNYKFYANYNSQIFGLSGTLGTVETRKVFADKYNLDTINIPPRLAKRFVTDPSQFVFDRKSWLDKIAGIAAKQVEKNPVLIIFEMIEDIEDFTTLIDVLKRKNNFPVAEVSKHYRKEDDIEHELEAISGARAGRIIIASNKGGRGTDIKLADDMREVGLYVIATYMPTSNRVLEQMIGRAARNGDRGAGCIIARVYPELYTKCFNKPSEYIEMQMRAAQYQQEKDMLHHLNFNIAAKALEEELSAKYRALLYEIENMNEESVYKERFKKFYDESVDLVSESSRRNNKDHSLSHQCYLDNRCYQYLEREYLNNHALVRLGMLAVFRKKWAIWFTQYNAKIHNAIDAEKRKQLIEEFDKDFIEFHKQTFINKNFEGRLLQSGNDYKIASDGILMAISKMHNPHALIMPDQQQQPASYNLYRRMSSYVNVQAIKISEYHLRCLVRAMDLNETSGVAGYNAIYSVWKLLENFEAKNFIMDKYDPENNNVIAAWNRDRRGKLKLAVKFYKHAYNAIYNMKIRLQQNLAVAEVIKVSADPTFDLENRADYYKQGLKERISICNFHLRIINMYIADRLTPEDIRNCIIGVSGDKHPALENDNINSIYHKLVKDNVIYIDKIRKKWRKMDPEVAKNTLRYTLKQLEGVIKLEDLYSIIFSGISGDRKINRDAIKQKCYSRNELWDILVHNAALDEVKEVWLLGGKTSLANAGLSSIKDKVVSLFQEHGIAYESEIIHCDLDSTFISALNNSANKDIMEALRKAGLPRKTRLAKFNLEKLESSANFGRYADLKIYDSDGNYNDLPKVMHEVAKIAIDKLNGIACEDGFPFKPTEQQVDVIMFALYGANLLKSGRPVDKIRRSADVISSRIINSLLRSDSPFHLERAHVDAITQQFFKLYHRIFDEEGEPSPAFQTFEQLMPKREVPYELGKYFAPLDLDKFLLFYFIPPPKKNNLGDALVVAIIGVVEIVVGAILIVYGGPVGVLVGQYLIKQGIGDIVYAAMAYHKGHFSWEEWKVYKAISLAVAIVCFGIDYYYMDLSNTADAAVMQNAAAESSIMGTVVLEAARQSLTGIIEAIITDVAVQAALAAIIDQIIALVTDKIVKDVDRAVRNNLHKAKRSNAEDYHLAVERMKKELCAALESNGKHFAKMEQTRNQLKQILEAVGQKFDTIRQKNSDSNVAQTVYTVAEIMSILNACYEEVKTALATIDVADTVKGCVDAIGDEIIKQPISADEESLAHITEEVIVKDAESIKRSFTQVLRALIEADLATRLSTVVKVVLAIIDVMAKEKDEEKRNAAILKIIKSQSVAMRAVDLVNNMEEYLQTPGEQPINLVEKQRQEKNEQIELEKIKKQERIKQCLLKKPRVEVKPQKQAPQELTSQAQAEEPHEYAPGPRREFLNPEHQQTEEPPVFNSLQEVKEYYEKKHPRIPPMLLQPRGNEIRSWSKSEYDALVAQNNKNPMVLFSVHKPGSISSTQAALEISNKKSTSDNQNSPFYKGVEGANIKDVEGKLNAQSGNTNKFNDSKETKWHLLQYHLQQNQSTEHPTLAPFYDIKAGISGYQQVDSSGNFIGGRADFRVNVAAARYTHPFANDYVNAKAYVEALGMNKEFTVAGGAKFDNKGMDATASIKYSMQVKLFEGGGELQTPLICALNDTVCFECDLAANGTIGAKLELESSLSSTYGVSSKLLLGRGVYGEGSGTCRLYFPGFQQGVQEELSKSRPLMKY